MVVNLVIEHRNDVTNKQTHCDVTPIKRHLLNVVKDLPGIKESEYSVVDRGLVNERML